MSLLDILFVLSGEKLTMFKAVDPDQLVRMMSGTMTSQEDLESGFATIGPLYAVPDQVQDKVEMNPMVALDGAFMPVRGRPAC